MEGVLFSVQGGVSAICSECFCSPVVRMVSDTPIHPHVQSVKTTARSVRSVSGVCRKKIKKKKRAGMGFTTTWRSFTYARKRLLQYVSIWLRGGPLHMPVGCDCGNIPEQLSTPWVLC